MHAFHIWAKVILIWFFLTGLWVCPPPLTHFAQLCFLDIVWCFPLVCLSLKPPCPCNPSKSWALMHRLPYFSTEMTVACREGCTLCVCACHFCAIFGRVPVFSLHQRLSYGSLLGPFLLWLDHIPQNPALVGNVSVVFSSHHKEHKLLYCLPHPILTGCVWPCTPP